MSGQLLKSGKWKHRYGYRVQQCNEHKRSDDHAGCKQTFSLVILFKPLADSEIKSENTCNVKYNPQKKSAADYGKFKLKRDVCE